MPSADALDKSNKKLRDNWQLKAKHKRPSTSLVSNEVVLIFSAEKAVEFHAINSQLRQISHVTVRALLRKGWDVATWDGGV